jgi:hypothetical protein
MNGSPHDAADVGKEGDAADVAKTAPDSGPDAPPGALGGEGGVDTSADAGGGRGPAEASAAQPAPGGGLALSDDFEETGTGGPPNPALWTIAQPDCTGVGKLSVDDSQAHSGKHSVRVDGGGGYCDHIFFANSVGISTLGPQVYARFFVRVSAPLGAGHVTFLAMKDTRDMGNDVRMGGQDMVLMYNRQSDDATLPVLSPTGTGKSIALTQDKWTCVELHVDEGAGTIDTWIDGAEIAGLVENGTAVPDVSTQWLSRAGWKPSLSDFRLGWESYSGQTMTLWFDDVALSAARIGCAG